MPSLAEVAPAGGEAAPPLTVVGLSFRSAPLAVRETCAPGPDDLPGLLQRLRALPGVRGALVLSTCNRIEVWLDGDEPPAGAVVEALSGGRVEVPIEAHRGRAAVRHVLRVASGLDSLVPGDAQILGQVKAAAAAAEGRQTLSPLLRAVVGAATSTARRVRTETAIGRRPVSVAHVALTLLAEATGGMAGRRALVVGTGKIGRVAACRLAEMGATVVVAGRTSANAEALAAEVGGTGCGLDRLPAELTLADVVVTCTGAPLPLLDRAAVERARREPRALAIADLALPRDVHADVAELPFVRLYDLDSIQEAAAAHLAERRQEASAAESLVAEEVDGFTRRLAERGAAPLVTRLRERGETIRQGELGRARRRLGPLSTEQEQAVQALTRAIVNKLLHAPSVQLRALAGQAGSPEAALAQALFALDADGPRRARNR